MSKPRFHCCNLNHGAAAYGQRKEQGRAAMATTLQDAHARSGARSRTTHSYPHSEAPDEYTANDTSVAQDLRCCQPPSITTCGYRASETRKSILQKAERQVTVQRRSNDSSSSGLSEIGMADRSAGDDSNQEYRQPLLHFPHLSSYIHESIRPNLPQVPSITSTDSVEGYTTPMGEAQEIQNPEQSNGLEIPPHTHAIVGMETQETMPISQLSQDPAPEPVVHTINSSPLAERNLTVDIDQALVTIMYLVWQLLLGTERRFRVADQHSFARLWNFHVTSDDEFIVPLVDGRGLPVPGAPETLGELRRFNFPETHSLLRAYGPEIPSYYFDNLVFFASGGSVDDLVQLERIILAKFYGLVQYMSSETEDIPRTQVEEVVDTAPVPVMRVCSAPAALGSSTAAPQPPVQPC